MEIAFCYPEPEAFRYSHKLGSRLGYLDICWPRLQPEPDVFDFSYYDSVVEECAAMGMDLIGMVASRRVTFPDGYWIWDNSRGMRPDPKAWTDFLKVVVDRYKNTIRYWEIWSEPNCFACNPMDYYDPRPFIEVVKMGSTAIREADSTAKIMPGGLWFNAYLNTFAKSLLDGSLNDYFDIFCFHYFLMVTEKDSTPFKLWKEPLSRWVDYFRSHIPEGRPIWITEFGIPTQRNGVDMCKSSTLGKVVGISEEEQADWFAQFAELAENEWDIGTLVWICLTDRDDMGDPTGFNNNIGMLRADWSEKPVKPLVAEIIERNSAKLKASTGEK